MPTYVYQCVVCEGVKEVVKPLSRLNQAEFCRCGSTMDRMIQAPSVRGDYAPYNCPVTGRVIEGRKAHFENLKRTGCRILEPGEKEQNMRRRKMDEEQFDKAVDETVEGFVHNLPTAKREQLITEIASGADVALTRTAV